MDKKYLWELLSKINNRYGLGALELCLASNWFNPFATIYLNLRSFPFTQAFKFPVWVIWSTSTLLTQRQYAN